MSIPRDARSYRPCGAFNGNQKICRLDASLSQRGAALPRDLRQHGHELALDELPVYAPGPLQRLAQFGGAGGIGRSLLFPWNPGARGLFPGAYPIFDLGRGLSRDANTFLYLSVSACLIIIAISSMAWSRSARLNDKSGIQVTLLLLLSVACAYPVWFALDRGNLDLWLACACVIFVASLRSRFELIGLVALAVAISAGGVEAGAGAAIERDGATIRPALD